MPAIDPPSDQVRRAKGVHLYHDGLSPCSQRVRIGLAEKGVPWTSHVIDLARQEHATAAYQTVHPRGLVPALVHDGLVVIESVDILRYLDDRFPGPPLIPPDAIHLAIMERWLAVLDRVDPAAQVLTLEFLAKARRRMSPRQLEHFARQHRNDDLVALHRELSEEGGFSRGRVQGALDAIEDALRELDLQLRASDHVAGDRFGLVDAAWVVHAHALEQMGYPLDRWPHVLAWYRRVAARPSFEEAVGAWQPRVTSRLLALYQRWRSLRGTDLRALVGHS